MGRVRAYIDVNGRKCWTLFDTGARNSYVIERVAHNLQLFTLDKPESVALGGKTHDVVQECRLICKIEGLPMRTLARVLKQIGKDEEGKEIEILFGALAMQEWGIHPVPEKEELDLTHYPKEFVEFFEQIIKTLEVIWEKGKGRITLNDVGGRKCLGFMFGNSGYTGQNLEEIIKRAREGQERGQFLLDNLEEIRNALMKKKIEL